MNERARAHRPQLDRVEVRHRGVIARIDGVLLGGEAQLLCRLRFGGAPYTWRFAICLVGRDG
ncbi:hypothetical protein ABZ208_13090 [Streptomyces sp. NPDC006208]|uniref:hypothetical protein n=1 Tax=Streptomyces sp. NPDC006208 TaxID=3156734 RepID=UPI0033A13C84